MAKKISTQCPNGHFYDPDQFASCPYCNSGSGNFPGGDDATIPFFNQPGGNGFPGDNDVTVGYDNNNWAAGGDVTQPFGSAPVYRDPIPSPGVTQEFNTPFIQNTIDDDKTIPYFQPIDNSRKEAAVQSQYYPVVGWLVCIEGCNYGKSFILKSGKNFVGRSSNMDVCLAGDDTISREKHAIITYEPRARKFFAQPGDSHELFYVNDNVILTSAELHDRDIVSIGETNLMFVPFCDERFAWERNKKTE